MKSRPALPDGFSSFQILSDPLGQRHCKPDLHKVRQDKGNHAHSNGGAHVLIPAVDEQARTRILQVASMYPRLAQAMQIVTGESHRTIEAADAVLVASGTAALECALDKKPMVVGYKMPALPGMIMQKKALIHCVSLPNILLGENVVPEFPQFFCEPDPISYALEDALQNEARRRMLEERFSAMHESLIADTPALAADVIMSVARS